MARNYRLLHAAVMFLALGVLIAASVPTRVTALSVSDRGGSTAFCDTLATRAEAAQNRFKTLQSKVKSAWESQDTRLKSLGSKFDDQVQAARDKIDNQRELNFAKLDDRASTDTEKAAVATYQTTVREAASTRRSAVDAARGTFRQAVSDAVKARRANLSNQASGLSTAVSVAYTTAQSNCDGGVEVATVRSTLFESLKNSRQTFAELRKSDDNIRDQIASLVKTRNATVKAADQAFISTIKDAAKDLKAAFGDNVDI